MKVSFATTSDAMMPMGTFAIHNGIVEVRDGDPDFLAFIRRIGLDVSRPHEFMAGLRRLGSRFVVEDDE